MNPFIENLISKVIKYKLSFLICIIITLLCVVFDLLISEKKAHTILNIKKRGVLNCGVEKNLRGFSVLNENSNWVGFNVDICRAVAISIFGDLEQVQFISNPKNKQFSDLKNKQIDLLIQNITWTLKKDSFFDFAGVTLYDGLSFMVLKNLGVISATELDGASVCIQTGTIKELYLASFFRDNKMSYEAVPVKNSHDAIKKYKKGVCDVVIANQFELATKRASFTDAENHIILPRVISKNPLGIMINQNESLLKDIIQWTLFLLITAEELGITSNNVDTLYKNSNHFHLQFFKNTKKFSQKNGLNSDWAYQVIHSIGNYGEVFEKHLGSNTSMNLKRGLNELWIEGGIIYAPPFY